MWKTPEWSGKDIDLSGMDMTPSYSDLHTFLFVFVYHLILSLCLCKILLVNMQTLLLKL